jgi:hypothetical protein
MAAILPALNVDGRDAKLSRYFLPYQMAWIKENEDEDGCRACRRLQESARCSVTHHELGTLRLKAGIQRWRQARRPSDGEIYPSESE